MMSSGGTEWRVAPIATRKFGLLAQYEHQYRRTAHLIEEAVTEFRKAQPIKVEKLPTLAELRAKYPKPDAHPELTWDSWVQPRQWNNLRLGWHLANGLARKLSHMGAGRQPATDDLARRNECCIGMDRCVIGGVTLLPKSLEDMTGRPCRLNHLEKHCRRDVEAVTKLFHLLSVQLPLFLQNQGHNTLAAQVVRKVLLSESVGIH